MKYDFTSLLNRSGHDAIAVDQIPIPGAEVKEGFSRIPMWVADMNFPSLPTIQEAIHARVNEPHFGYFNLPDEYFDSIIRWQNERNGVEDLPREAIGYENGVLGCVASAAAAFTSPGEAILLHSPTYIGFTGVIENCGRKIILSDLVQDENGVWRMDYADMDRKLKENNIHFAIFCSPHNPTGRVWERDEIEKAMEIYSLLSQEFNVSYDESGSIGKRYRRCDAVGTPFAITVDDNTISDGTVTVRERDTMKQETVKIADLVKYIEDRIKL